MSEEKNKLTQEELNEVSGGNAPKLEYDSEKGFVADGNPIPGKADFGTNPNGVIIIT